MCLKTFKEKLFFSENKIKGKLLCRIPTDLDDNSLLFRLVLVPSSPLNCAEAVLLHSNKTKELAVSTVLIISAKPSTLPKRF